MAMEYASSPVAHPGTHTRMGKSPWRWFNISGMTSLLRYSKVSWIPEEGRHVDEQIAIQGIHFGGIGFQALQVGSHGLHFVENHAAQDAPAERAGLVLREIHSGGALHPAEDAVELRFVRLRLCVLQPGAPAAHRDGRRCVPVPWRFEPAAAQNQPSRTERWRCAACPGYLALF